MVTNSGEVVMSVTAQLLTLAAVIVGAIMSFAATSLSERRRFQREEATRWAGQKLDTYLEYLYAVKHMARIARCIAAARGINPYQPPLEHEDALLMLSEAEERRAQATEKVTLLGNEATVDAIRELNKEIWRLEKIARGGLTPDLETWRACNRSLVEAKNQVHQQIRAELGIPGKFRPRDLEQPYEPKLPDSAQAPPAPPS
jgi:hypothetical protein